MTKNRKNEIESNVETVKTFKIQTHEQLREALSGKLLAGEGKPSAAACMLAVLLNCGNGVEPSYVLKRAAEYGTDKATPAALGNLKHALKSGNCKQLERLRKVFARSVEAGIVNPALSFPSVATISGRLSSDDSDDTL